MLHEDGIELIKFWFSISKDEQEKRFKSRRKNPLKQWKMSPVDEKAQELWDSYTFYKQQMFAHTHTPYSPWIIIQADNKRRARLESMRYMLSKLKYEGKENSSISLRHVPTRHAKGFRFPGRPSRPQDHLRAAQRALLGLHRRG